MTTTLRDFTLSQLGHCKLKQKGDSGHYRGNSPLRSGADGGNFDLRFADESNGVWYDHKEGTGGHVRDLLARLNIELPDALRINAERGGTKRPYSSARDYASAHGLTLEQLSVAGWQEDTHSGRPALKFKTKSGYRWRFLDGKTPAYISEQGYRSCWYGLERAVKLARESGLPLIICNGEISTVSAQAVGIPGACVTSGEKALPDDLIQELRTVWQGELVIAFDCDEAGRKAAAQVKAQLPRARVFDLRNGDGGDLADFATLYAADAVNELRARFASEPEPTQPTAAAQTNDHMGELNQRLRDLRLAIAANDPNKKDKLTDEARRLLDQLEAQRYSAGVVCAADLMSGLSANLESAAQHPLSIRGLITGLDDVDALIGGFRNGGLYVVLAETGMGKSTLMATFADSMMCYGRGLIVATELSEASFTLKMIAARSALTAQLLEDGQDTHGNLLRHYNTYAKVRSALDDYAVLSKRFSFLLGSRATPKQIRRALEDAADLGAPFEWLMVDSMSNLRAPGEGIYERTTAASNALQGIAQNMNIPVIATCQIGRNTKQRASKIPTLMDALGSGAIEQDATGLFGLYWDHFYVRQGEDPMPGVTENQATLVCLKHRWRGSAAGSQVKLYYRPGSRFETWRGLPYDALAALEDKS